MARVSMEQLERKLNDLEGEQNKPFKNWLEEYTRKPNVANHYRKIFNIFLEWIGKTPKQLVQEFDQKETRNIILRFQSHLASKGFKNNSIAAYLTAVRSFYTSQCEPVRGLKRKVVQVEEATDEHIFSTEDLRKMWHVGDLRNKALLAVGMSLGWEVGQILDMDKDVFERQVLRARSEKQDFIAFNWVRPKEQKPQYGILSPCAIDSLERYLEKRKDNPDSRLWFDLTTEDAINDVLRALVRDAGIVTTGKVRWHLLRKWLMSQLDAAGLTEFQNKICQGKSLPVSDKTYLQSIKRTALEKYVKAYPVYLSPVAYSNGKVQIENIDAALKQVESENAIFKTRIDYLQKNLMEFEGKLKSFDKIIMRFGWTRLGDYTEGEAKAVEEYHKLREKKKDENKGQTDAQ